MTMKRAVVAGLLILKTSIPVWAASTEGMALRQLEATSAKLTLVQMQLPGNGETPIPPVTGAPLLPGLGAAPTYPGYPGNGPMTNPLLTSPLSMYYPGYPGAGYGDGMGLGGFISMLPMVVTAAEVVFDRINKGFGAVDLPKAGPFALVPEGTTPGSMSGEFWGWKPDGRSQEYSISAVDSKKPLWDRVKGVPKAHFHLNFHLTWAYAGQYKDQKGKYLHAVAVVFSDYTVEYITKVNVQLGVMPLGNVGTADNPIAAMRLVLNVKGDAPSMRGGSRSFIIRGDSNVAQEETAVAAPTSEKNLAAQ